MTFTSFAQNFEDVLLWRALGNVERGQYLDIGAQDPLIDSVSLAFYERGWRGLHVEPSPDYAAKLRAARPDETVIEAVVTDEVGPIEFFEVAGTGISTGRSDIAEHHAKEGRAVHKTLVPAVRLENLLERIDGEIHWLKIDVEGMEPDVLRSWGDSARRPWVLVVEATYPNTQVSTRDAWIEEVERRGYEQVFFDGLSCFFVHEGHRELKAKFDAPANVFDGFHVIAAHFAAVRVRSEMENVDRLRLEQQSRGDWLQAENARLVGVNAASQEDLIAAQARETELLENLRASAASLATSLTEAARFEERSNQLRAQLTRADDQLAKFADQLARAQDQAAKREQQVDELQSKLLDGSVENERLRGMLDRATSLIRAAAAERPGKWQRFGERLGVARPSRMLQTLSAWSDVQPEYSLPPTASAETVHQGEFLNMPGSGDQSRNPYLRADSIPELLAWHDLDFVRCAYVTVLGRQPDRRGELYYVDRLRRGYSKLGILWQLRTSKEGPRHDPGIAGFDKELRKHRNARSPLYGWLIRAVTGREADTPLERRLRALENLIGSTRTAPAGPALSAELSSLVETLRALPSTAAAAPAAESAPSPEIQIVRGRLSPRAQKFYDRAVN